tara:strand:+ start:507 stop:4772 length:4266 start_codon:yes stop_codon:yes gene_type:complete
MKKSCGITGITDPILSNLISKFGAREGFKTYFKVKELKLSDSTIKNKYLQEATNHIKRTTRKVERANNTPSIDTTAMGVESSAGLLSMKMDGTRATAYFKTHKTKKAAAKKVVQLQNELVKRNLDKIYSPVQRNTPNGIVVKLAYRATSTDTDAVNRLIPEAAAPHVKAQKEKLKFLNNQRRELENLLPQISDSNSRYLTVAKQLNTTEQLIKKTEQDVRRLKELNTVDQLFERADTDEKKLEKFFTKPAYTFEELREAQIMYDSWAVSSVMPGQPHPYLDNLEQQNKFLVDKMNAVSTRFAVRFGNLMEIRTKEAVFASTRKHGNTSNLTDAEILETLIEQDKGFLATGRAYTLNLGKQQPIIMQSLFNNVNKANNQAHNAAFNRINKLKEAAQGIRQRDMEAFYQKDAEGRMTGELVQPAMSEYIEGIREIQSSIDYATLELEVSLPNSEQRRRAENILTKANNARYTFYKNNSAPIDPSILVPDISSFAGQEAIGIPADLFTTSDVDPIDARKDLEKRFGKAEANRMLRKQRNITNAFVNQRDALISNLLESKDKLSETDVQYLKDWSAVNSPFLAYKSHTTNESVGRYLPSFKYTLAVPNQENTDSNYENMVQTYPEMAKFYDIMVDLIEEGRAEVGDISGFITGLSLPTMEAGFFKEMMSDGPGLLLPKLVDSYIIAKTTVANEAAYEQPNLHEDVDKIVNQKEVNVNAVTMHRTAKSVNEELIRLKTEFIEENGEEAFTAEVKRRLKKDAINTVYTKSSTNLVGLMSMFALNVQTIKAKRAIEPQVNIIKNFIINQETTAGALNQSASVKAMDYFLDKEFFGIDPGDNVGKGGIKVKSRQEKESARAVEERQLDIEEKIAEIEDRENSGEIMSQPDLDELERLKKEEQDLEKQLDKMGRFFKLSKIGDMALSLTQLIGIGFSPVSAVGNIGIGYVANQIAAADSRDFSASSMGRAYGFILGGNSVRFLTFGKLDKLIQSNHRDKIKNLIDANQMVTSIFDEVHHNTSKLTGKSKGAFRASHLMERSEFVNQAAVLVGMMLDTEVTLTDGSTMNLYEAYDEEGKLREDIDTYQTKSATESKPWDPNEFFQYAKHIIEETHGDYNHSVLLKKVYMGRALSTFRTWMYRTYAARYSPEHYDAIAGYTRKGRYRSAAPVLGLIPFINRIPFISKFLPPIVIAGSGIEMGNLVPKGMRERMGIKESKGNTDLVTGLGKIFKNSIGVYGDFFKSILVPHKYKTRFREKLEDRGMSDVDTANVAAVFSEYLMKSTLALTMLLLYNMYDEDDDQAKKSAIIVALNLSRRFEKDIAFYADITEQGRTLDNPLAVMRLTQGVEQFSNAIDRVMDDSRDSYLQSGFYEGWWAPTKIAFRYLPGLTAVDQTRRYLNLDIMSGNMIEDQDDLYRAFESNLSTFGVEEP